MKIELFKTTFATYFLHKDSRVLEQLWTNENGKMWEEEFKTEMQSYLNLIEEKQPKLVLINLKSFYFTITNELQEWVDEKITARDNKIIQKIAFILPSEMIIR